MLEHHESTSASTAREQELEIEVARLQAEIDTLRGDDPTAVTSRFLTMAAETVDKAVADARREADEIVEEISSEAEARRDEATRVAAEAEAMAEQLLAKADRAQEAVADANQQAAEIKAEAEAEAAAIVAAEREKISLEIEAVAEIRSALDDERVALDSYHGSLRSRVQELAVSMVAFMQTELPPVDNDALEGTALGASGGEDGASEGTTASPSAIDESESGDESEDLLDAPPPAVDVHAAADDMWVQMLDAAIPEADHIVDMPDSAIDEVPVGPPSTFGGVPVIEGDQKPAGGLFSRIRPKAAAPVGFDDLTTDDDDEDDDEVSLFGTLGPRLVEQTPPDTLAEALDTDDSDDHAFRQFLDGDDAPDPSRDWLLRPEQT
jgi:hypothetical protein